MTHLLIIPDGMRRYARAKGIGLARSYEHAAVKLAKLSGEILRNPHFAELTLFLAAPSDFERDMDARGAMRAGADLFFDRLPDYIGRDVAMCLIGEWASFATFAPQAFKNAVALARKNDDRRKKRLNILAFYDYYTACPLDESLETWRPFCEPIDLVLRFAQPQGLICGSALFPMSEHAFWHGVPDVFPAMPVSDIGAVATRLLARAGRVTIEAAA